MTGSDVKTSEERFNSDTPDKTAKTDRNGDIGLVMDHHTSSKVAFASQSPNDQREDVPDFTFSTWIVYASAVANYSLSLSIPLVMSTLFKDWQDEFGVSRAHTAVVYSTTVGIVFGAAILPGYVMNRLGPRVTMLVGYSLSFTGCFLSCFATSINFLIFSTGVLGGLGFCFIQLPSIPTISLVIKPKFRSTAVAICTCGIALCSMGFPFLYRHLVHQYSWRGTFAIISALCLQTSVFGLIMTSHVKRAPPVDKVKKIKSRLLERKQTLDSYDTKKDSINRNRCHKDDDKLYQCSREDLQIQTAERSNPEELRQCEAQVRSNNTNSKCFHRLDAVFHRIRNSRWKFLVDFMYVIIVMHLCTCIATMYGFLVMMMDFAYTKGFVDDTTGAFFLFLFFITSLIGRLVIGPLNILPYLHSFILMGIFGVVASASIIALGSATDYSTIVSLLAAQGVAAGGLFGIYTKSVLDVDSVDLNIYPLALGTAGTLEGFMDFFIPVLIGYTVDATGSYELILPILGSMSLATSLILLIVKTYLSYQTHKANRSDAEKVSLK